MNRLTKIMVPLIGLLLSFVTGAASASIDFQDVASMVGPVSGNIVSNGYVFSTNGSNIGSHIVSDLIVTPDTAQVSMGSSNASLRLEYAATPGYTESFASVFGSLFNLTSIDMGGGYRFGPGTDVSITGVRSDYSTVSQQYTLLPASFTTYVLSGFTNLKSVTLGSAGLGYVAVDNIVTSPVPEPETYAMLLAGLGLIGALVRRQTRAKNSLD